MKNYLLIPTLLFIFSLFIIHPSYLYSQEQGNKSNQIKVKKTKPYKVKRKYRKAVVGMVYVKGGTFQIVNNGSESTTKPLTEVKLDDFFIGIYEVTQKKWMDIMGNEPSSFNHCDSCPVEQVSWNDVQEFIKKLNSISKFNYRLPTEAEWEYAARGGNKSQGFNYSGSNTVSDVAWFTENSGLKTHSILKKPNELGIYNMSGNVWEWCSDWYDENSFNNSPLNNPQGPIEGTHHVYRGGGWSSAEMLCKVSYRNTGEPNSREDNIGFRIAITLPK